jgi:hypothetical protein
MGMRYDLAWTIALERLTIPCGTCIFPGFRLNTEHFFVISPCSIFKLWLMSRRVQSVPVTGESRFEAWIGGEPVTVSSGVDSTRLATLGDGL